MQTFTLIFLAAVFLTLFAKLWLALRHITYVSAHRDAVPPAFREQVSLVAHQKAADYSVAKTRLGIAHTILDTVVLLAFTLGGGLQALLNFWSSVVSGPLWQGVAIIASAVIIFGALEMPLNLYRVFVVEERFGFNKMTLRLFLIDLVKGSLLGAAFGVPLLLLVLWLMDRMGGLWWLYVWLVWAGFNLLVLAIYPTFIAPLFNKFTPLEDATLKSRIERLLEKCGFRSQGLFVMDGSKRSSHGNAYFTGFGRSKRIVFLDTLLQRLTHDEIEAVLAHELGHFKRKHVTKRIVLMFSLSLLYLAALGWLIDKPWFFEGLNVSGSGNAVGLLLFFVVTPVFTFLLHPISSLYSRRHEFEADDYAAQHASAAHLIRALVKLYKDNAATLTPDPMHSTFYDSHPPAAQRVAHLERAAHNA